MKDRYKEGLLLAGAPLVVGAVMLLLLQDANGYIYPFVALCAFFPCLGSVLMALWCLVSVPRTEQSKYKYVWALGMFGLILLAPVMVVWVFREAFEVYRSSV